MGLVRGREMCLDCKMYCTEQVLTKQPRTPIKFITPCNRCAASRPPRSPEPKRRIITRRDFPKGELPSMVVLADCDPDANEGELMVEITPQATTKNKMLY